MPRIPLTAGAYQSRSVIAGAQRCINLFPESNPEDANPPVPITHYPTPGITAKVQCPDYSVVRGLYRASNGELYAVCGASVYFIDSSFGLHPLGSIASGTTPVSMKDNGLCLLLVDGSATGYVIDISSGAHSFSTILDPNFLGGLKVDYIDTYFILNQPGTRNFYISLSEINYTMATTAVAGSAFNALDIVGKSGGSDPISTLACVHREAWIVGTLTSEVWVDQGTPDFPLGELPGTFVEHGCVAPYSMATHDVIPFWLSQDKDGRGIVVRGDGYSAKRISTHVIEEYIAGYATISDAIGFCYQVLGHVFYVLTFPTADVTWVYEVGTGQWHEWAFLDANGALHRHRANCATQAYNFNLVGDWQNGIIYAVDTQNFTDNGNPILRLRSFPHVLNDGKRLSYASFIADIQVGQIPGQLSSVPSSSFNNDVSNDFGGNSLVLPKIFLRWSDTRGASWGEKVTQTLGSTGQYYSSIKWSRLGMARDRVFELSWSEPIDTALNGAFIDVVQAAS